MALSSALTHLVLQAAAASQEAASGQQTVIAEVVERGLIGDILETIAWIAGGAVVLFIIFLVYRRISRSAVRGEEFSTIGLKALHERGVIDEKEYQVIKRKMAERITRQLAEEAKRRQEESLAKDPIAAIAQRAKMERQTSGGGPLGEASLDEQLQRAIDSDGPPPPPPPPPPPKP